MSLTIENGQVDRKCFHASLWCPTFDLGTFCHVIYKKYLGKNIMKIMIYRFKMSIHIPNRYIYEVVVVGNVAGLVRRCGDHCHWAPVAASPALAPGLHLHSSTSLQHFLS